MRTNPAPAPSDFSQSTWTSTTTATPGSVYLGMDRHPSYSFLKDSLHKYPRNAGALFQTYNDLTLGQKWTDVELVDLPECGRGAMVGFRPKITITESSIGEDDAVEDKERAYVVPCTLTETLSMAWVHKVFDGLPGAEVFYLAIAAEDSSVVYYKLSKGIIKPPL
jgi:tRNA-splicing endonuclease subunit Sen15, fungi type